MFKAGRYGSLTGESASGLPPSLAQIGRTLPGALPFFDRPGQPPSWVRIVSPPRASAKTLTLRSVPKCWRHSAYTCAHTSPPGGFCFRARKHCERPRTLRTKVSRRSVRGGQAGFLAPAIRFLYAWREARKKANEPSPGREDDDRMCGRVLRAARIGSAFRPLGDREALIREAFRLEWLTIGWMSVEAIVALASGLAAGSLVLMAFGLDSVIELASAGALIWRLRVELRRGQAFSENAERLASRIAGGLLFALAAYVTIAALWSLGRDRAKRSRGRASSWPWLRFLDALSGASQDRHRG